ncbi:hypothetical protein DFH27DRAFT_165349 [Peziza echinospora]|nr:hypothetical protein DFH27DRAFT_165349 [Peziza echinospora]
MLFSYVLHAAVSCLIAIFFFARVGCMAPRAPPHPNGLGWVSLIGTFRSVSYFCLFDFHMIFLFSGFSFGFVSSFHACFGHGMSITSRAHAFSNCKFSFFGGGCTRIPESWQILS